MEGDRILDSGGEKVGSDRDKPYEETISAVDGDRLGFDAEGSE